MSDAKAVFAAVFPEYTPDGANPAPPEAEAPATPSAAAAAATSAAEPTAAQPEDSEVEVISLDEALAELDGQAAPPQPEAAPGTEPSPGDAQAEAAPVTLTEQERRELDEYRASKAQEAAARQEAEFLTPWQQLQAANDAFFDREISRIEELGKAQGRSEDEIELAIYRRVELGNGFGIQRPNPETGVMETIGRIQAEREFDANLRAAMLAYERSKTTPSAFEQTVARYQLDETDRTALARFINYPPEHLDAIAQALAVKNQRLSSTQQQIRHDAVQNVKAHLASGIGPGTPSQSPKEKRVVIDSSRKSTEFVARSLGYIR